MTPEALNPASARFDFMKWVSLHQKDEPIPSHKGGLDQYFLNLIDEEGADDWGNDWDQD